MATAGAALLLFLVGLVRKS